VLASTRPPFGSSGTCGRRRNRTSAFDASTRRWAEASGFTKLGVFFDAAAVPFVMVIDARTMEIASAGVGGVTSSSEIDAQADDVTSRPAAY